MAQPTGSLMRITQPAAAAEESDDEDLSFFLTSPQISVAANTSDNVHAVPSVVSAHTNVVSDPPSKKSLLAAATQDGAAQPMGTATDFLASSSFGYSSQLPPLFVPPYYLPLAHQIQQLQQQNQLQQQIIRQQQQQAQQHLRQLQDLQLAQQQQQIAQLQHEQQQRERERQDPLQPLKETDLLRQPLQRLHSLTSTTPAVAGSQPTSTLHQVHSVGPAIVGSQLPPVSSQLWNFSLMGTDPYLGTFNSDPATSLAALQTYYQTQFAAAQLQLAEKAASLAVPPLHSSDAIAPGKISPLASTLTAAKVATQKRASTPGLGKDTKSHAAKAEVAMLGTAKASTNAHDHHGLDLCDDLDVKVEPLSDDDSPVRCEWAGCNQDFLGSRALADHVRQSHCRAESNDEFICKWATCKRQQKPFPIPQQFLRHMQTHTREKPYQCKHPGCGQTFTQANVLAAHTRTHTGEKPYQCNVAGCGKKFAYANCLLAHTRSHTGEKPRVCKVCGKGFSGLSNLTAHMRTHTGERPYQCKHEGCGKSFTTSSDLVRHTRIHTGQKPFECKVEDCRKRFTTSSQLNNHLRTHTGERPYPCKVIGCDKRFADLTTLRRHEQAHDRKRKPDEPPIPHEGFVANAVFYQPQASEVPQPAPHPPYTPIHVAGLTSANVLKRQRMDVPTISDSTAA